MPQSPISNLQSLFFHVHPGYGYRPRAPHAPPAVSVVTPYYNTGAVFLETAQSLLRQSLQQWEWIIVNDGSDDEEALRALLPLRSADARVRVIDQPNRGLPAARNAGAAAARAPLLYFLDSDDLLAPTLLEKLAWTLHSRPESAFAGAWYRTFGASNVAWPRGFDTRYAFLHENMTSALAMVRRPAWQEVGGFDEARTHGLEDYEFWLRCAARGMWGHDVRELLIAVRRKASHEYRHYRWDFEGDDSKLRDFRREMRARYPELFRRGLPPPGDGSPAGDAHALLSTALPFDNGLERPEGQRRALLLLPWLQLGGADRFALGLARGMAERGDRVSVALLRSGPHPWLPEMERVTSDVFDLAAFLRPADYPRFLHYLIASRGINTVLISNSLLAYQLLPYLRAACPDVAFVDMLHAEEPWRQGGFPRAAVQHGGLLERHIAASEHLRHWMVERGADPERTTVCHTGVDTAHFSPDPALRAATRSELGLPDDTPVVLFLGRLAPEKRPLLALELLLGLRDRPWTLLVAGDGPQRRALHRYVKRSGAGERVRLLGGVQPARVRALLAASDVLLLPSEREGIALTLFEALAMGVVPVASDVGGQRELVTPECGVLVPLGPNERDAYKDALRRLLESSQERARMARAGRARTTAHFRSDQMVERLRELLWSAGERPQPAVSTAAGLAAATLAIEHFQLEERLRAFPPVRLALRLRGSPLASVVGRLGALRPSIELLDGALYALRRTVMTYARRQKAKGKRRKAS